MFQMISPLNNKQEFKIEAHQIDNTIVNVQALDRPWAKIISSPP